MTQIWWTSKWLLFLDTPEHVDSENINFKIGHAWELPLPTFFKTWFKFIKYSQNWSKLTDFQTFLGYFYVFQVVEHILTDIGRYNIIDIISYHYITFSRILIFFISFFNRWYFCDIISKFGPVRFFIS